MVLHFLRMKYRSLGKKSITLNKDCVRTFTYLLAVDSESKIESIVEQGGLYEDGELSYLYLREIMSKFVLVFRKANYYGDSSFDHRKHFATEHILFVMLAEKALEQEKVYGKKAKAKVKSKAKAGITKRPTADRGYLINSPKRQRRTHTNEIFEKIDSKF